MQPRGWCNKYNHITMLLRNLQLPPSPVATYQLRKYFSSNSSVRVVVAGATVFAIISAVSVQRAGASIYPECVSLELEEVSSKCGVEERRHDNVAWSYSNPNKSKRPRRPTQPDASSPMVEEACTTGSEISINL